MFDIGWSELVVLGVIALIVVGPKELPALLRTIGRYTGFLKKQASEFRAQFDQAMREAELDQIKKDVQSFKDDITSTVQATTKTLTDEIDSAKRQLEIPELDDPDAHDADGMPIQKPQAASPAPAASSPPPAVETVAPQTAPSADAQPVSPAVPNDTQSRHEPSATDTMKSGA